MYVYVCVCVCPALWVTDTLLLYTNNKQGRVANGIKVWPMDPSLDQILDDSRARKQQSQDPQDRAGTEKVTGGTAQLILTKGHTIHLAWYSNWLWYNLQKIRRHHAIDGHRVLVQRGRLGCIQKPLPDLLSRIINQMITAMIVLTKYISSNRVKRGSEECH